MDTHRRIVDFKWSRSLLLLHADVVNPLSTEHPGGAYNYLVDSSPYSHEIDRIDVYYPASQHPLSHYLDPTIGAWGKFDGGLRSWCGHIRWNNHEAFNIQNEDFTLDYWFKTAIPAVPPPPVTWGNWGYVDFDYTSAGGLIVGYIKMGFNENGQVFARLRGLTFELSGSGTTLYTSGQWNHLALVKAGTLHRLYLNGAIGYEWIADTTFSAPLDNSHKFLGNGWVTIPNPGDPPVVENYVYMDELHMELGAKWTGPFTPPTEPYDG